MLKEKFVIIISLFYLLIECFGPVVIVVNVIADFIYVPFEQNMAFRLDVFFVVIDNFVCEEVLLFFGRLFQNNLLFVADKFCVLLLLILEVGRVEAFNLTHFLNSTDFS